MNQYQVNVAGEAIAAAIMSQAGYGVAIQYGTTQEDWDIIAKKESRTLMLSVKGSQDGGWGLFQSYIQKANYHGALNAWFKCQPKDIVYFFVQFKGVAVGAAPRCYIARPKEILAHMRTTRAGLAYTSLREHHVYTRGAGHGHTDIIPAAWLVTQKRIDAV